MHAGGIEHTNNTPAEFAGLSPFPFPVSPHAVLIRIIEGEIIPRLFLTHCNHRPRRLDNLDHELDNLLNSRILAELFLRGDSSDILCRLQMLMDRGMRREEIYLEFLACVPRTLSLFWEEGYCSFEEIAQGLKCLDHVLDRMHEREISMPIKPAGV